jgi:hypothetical protein
MRLFVTAEAFDAKLATDEWPLRYVVSKLGGKDVCATTLDIFALWNPPAQSPQNSGVPPFELAARSGEELPAGLEARYRELFGEAPTRRSRVAFPESLRE